MDAKSDLEAKLRLRLIQKLGLKKDDSDASTKKDVKNENCSNNQMNKDDTVKNDHAKIEGRGRIHTIWVSGWWAVLGWAGGGCPWV